MPIIPAHKKLREEDHCVFKARMGFILSLKSSPTDSLKNPK